MIGCGWQCKSRVAVSPQNSADSAAHFFPLIASSCAYLSHRISAIVLHWFFSVVNISQCCVLRIKVTNPKSKAWTKRSKKADSSAFVPVPPWAAPESFGRRCNGSFDAHKTNAKVKASRRIPSHPRWFMMILRWLQMILDDSRPLPGIKFKGRPSTVAAGWVEKFPVQGTRCT